MRLGAPLGSFESCSKGRRPSQENVSGARHDRSTECQPESSRSMSGEAPLSVRLLADCPRNQRHGSRCSQSGDSTPSSDSCRTCAVERTHSEDADGWKESARVGDQSARPNDVTVAGERGACFPRASHERLSPSFCARSWTEWRGGR